MRFVPARFLPSNRSKRNSRTLKDFISSPLPSFFPKRDKARTDQREETFFPVYKVTLLLPSLCQLANGTSAAATHHPHLVLYVQTDSTSGTGYVHHVTGSLAETGGLAYVWQPFSPARDAVHVGRRASVIETGEAEDNQEGPTIVSSEALGWTMRQTYPEAWEENLRSLPTPEQQLVLNEVSGRWERVGRWSPTSGEPREVWEEGAGPDVVGCREWMLAGAIPMLEGAGLIIRSVV
jgi:hypothetical protein